MTDRPDHLAAALDFDAHARRARDEDQRARLLALSAKYREMAIAEAVPFVMEMPKRPAAPSVRRPAARGQKTA
jgi:hypothetical protein